MPLLRFCNQVLLALPGERPRKLYAERALNLPLGAELITGNMWYPRRAFLCLCAVSPMITPSCVCPQRPAVDLFELGGSGRRGWRSRRLPLPAAHRPGAQAPSPEDAPRDLPGASRPCRALSLSPARDGALGSSGGGLSGGLVGRFHSGETEQEDLLQAQTLSGEVDQCFIRPPHPDRPSGQVSSPLPGLHVSHIRK